MVVGGQGLGVDKINILLQTSIGVLRIEGASLDPPYISILESRKASDLNACYRESTVADNVKQPTRELKIIQNTSVFTVKTNIDI